MLRSLLLPLLVTFLVLAPRGALAHDELLGSDPADGASGVAPAQVTLTFSGQIAQVGATVVVTDGSGASVVAGEPVAEGTEVVQPLAADLAPGAYEVVWRVTSQDGHPISGTFGFEVEGVPAAEEAPDAEEQEAAASDDGSEVVAAAPATQEPVDEPADTPAPDMTEDEAGGLPLWVWIFVAVAVAGLLALLAQTWRRNRA
ncbi:copper resistance CopC family protein [Ornithinimicrobium flavum]|uniref:copper resistance CopC family protein n=1 Tax=Ornithinimicrobium flavum TaxID=1288636 RepID=UPI001EE8CF84|nr:copper resistance CopC family protein [Ornithinimicrobium flavum]